MNKSNIAEEYAFFKPEIDEVDYLLDKVNKVCRKKFFHPFKQRCVYDIKFANITIVEKVNLSKINDCLKFKSEYYGLNKKKSKFAKCIKFNFEILKLTIKIYSNLSNINIHYYLKLRIPILHRQFFNILSQSPDYVKTHCIDGNDLFHFALRKWFLYIIIHNVDIV